MLVGILGGSFNPPHRGHLALARTVLELGLAERVLFIPAAVPPHKVAPREADADTRLAMTRLLVDGEPDMDVSDVELRRSGPSFTIDTVRELQSRNPGDRYRLIIGSDMAKSFHTWREYHALLELAPPLIAERPDSLFDAPIASRYPGLDEREAAVMEGGRFVMSPVDINSTLVRKLLSGGAADAEMGRYLTEPVLRFIRRQRLYV